MLYFVKSLYFDDDDEVFLFRGGGYFLHLAFLLISERSNVLRRLDKYSAAAVFEHLFR